MTVYYFIQYEPSPNGDVPVVIHAVKVPSLIDKDGYRQITSMEAFARFEREKVWDTKKGGWAKKPYTRRYSKRDGYDMRDILASRLYGIGERRKEFKVIRHRSIWDFYLAIGYEYKKKRYVS